MIRYLIIVVLLSDCVFSKYLNLSEGSNCEWDGINGKCVNFFKCQSAPDYVKNRTPPPTCSFDDKVPIICCTDCNVVEDVRKIKFNDNLGYLYFDGPKAKDKCVSYADTLPYPCKSVYKAQKVKTLDPISNCYTIGDSIGGFSTPFPPRKESYMAFLGYRDESNDVKLQCAGSIISEKYVLTAAQCVSNPELFRGTVQYVAVDFEKGDIPLWQTYIVKMTFLHPEYEYPMKYHDIALVKTKKKIFFNEAVLPACLLYTEEFDQKSAETIVKTSAEADQGSLTPASLSHLDDFACSFLYPSQAMLPHGFNATIQACYGNTEKPEDSCLSENGSPLIAEYEAVSCAPVIFGVTSIDRICGPAGSSGLYTRVSYYVPWIESIVWP